LRLCEIFKYHDIFLYFVNPQLDSRDPQFERLIINYANEDQQCLHKLRHAVRRGQKDRARNGLTPGSSRYGYTTELVPDPTRRGTIVRPAVLGTRIVIPYPEHMALHPDRPDPLVTLNKGIPHFCAFAKYAVAFPRM